MGKNKENRLSERVWEIDALRGLMIMMVMATHLYYCVDAFCIDGYYNIDSYKWVEITDPLHFWFDWGEDGVIHQKWIPMDIFSLWIRAGVSGFFVISGISCIFSRDNLKSGIRLLGAALFLSAFTFGLWKWTGDSTRFIRFGAIHCYACCHFIYVFFLEKRSSKTLLLVSVPVFIIGYYLRYHHVESNFALLYPFGIYETAAAGSDYWPILPLLGWFLVGVVIGRKYYSAKKSLIPSKAAEKWTGVLRWCGRYSGVLYIAHIVVYTVVFCGIGYIFGLIS